MKSRPARLAALALLIVVLGAWFDSAYEPLRLYSSNQNTYMLHGLARAPVGLLREDWLANTLDPTPVFTRLVELMYRRLPESSFHAAHVILAGIYLFSLVGIAVEWRRSPALRWSSRAKSAAVGLAAGLVVIHADMLERFGFAGLAEKSVTRYLQQGVASQYILGKTFQPSAFGVLLVLAIWLFLRKRPISAVVASAIAATMHPTYVLPAVALNLGFVMSMRADPERSPRDATRLAIVSLALLLPITLYAVITFRATTPAWKAQADYVLVHSRIPHHAMPERWLTVTAWAQLVLVALALFAVRKSRLFRVLLTPFLISIVLTGIQLLWPQDGLALLFPWRISVLLVPVATMILASVIVRKIVSYRFHREAAIALVLVSGVLAVWGVREMVVGDEPPSEEAVAGFIARHKRSGDLYLVPTDLARIRLEIGAPIFVDHKSHPYKDVEIIEWDRRLSLAKSVYETGDCQTLASVAASYGITHAVIPAKPARPLCAGWLAEYKDAAFLIWRRSSRPRITVQGL